MLSCSEYNVFVFGYQCKDGSGDREIVREQMEPSE